ncbi:MAG: hypothetical protein ACRC5Q_08155 [Culicoidibacterales bacterium]
MVRKEKEDQDIIATLLKLGQAVEATGDYAITISRIYRDNENISIEMEERAKFPEILLLSKLAVYYAVSVDDLLRYERQLNRRQIQ